jgi:DNA modification methylase
VSARPYYQDDAVTLWHGDAHATLSEMPSASVDCIVTSPPYFGLRDYGVDGQIGAEQSPAEYVERLRTLFAEARRVLADDGTLWLNLGDSYVAARGQGNVGGGLQGGPRPSFREDRENVSASRLGINYGLPNKNLLGIPWRVAFALQDDGWTLRNDIIWAKPNAMPESVTDRLSNRHEHLFLFSKRARYWFDLHPIREPLAFPAERPQNSWARDTKEADVPGQSMRQHRPDRPGKAGGTNLRPTGRQHLTPDTNGGRNPGDVWTIPTVPFPGAHFAVFPPALAERCILAGCKPGGTVLDPFSGSGTTGMAAAKHGRRYVGVDLNADYLDLSLRTRLAQPGLDLEGVTA